MPKDDIDKLVHFKEKLIELQDMGGASGVRTRVSNFDHVVIQLPAEMRITQRAYNDDNIVTDTKTFPFSMLDQQISFLEEKIKYRKKIIEESKGKTKKL